MISLLTVLGSLAAAGGSLGFFTFPYGLKFGINSLINLKQNGFVYPMYMNPPFALTSKFYLFEIQNPREVLMGGKAKVNIKGPYVYSTRIKRSNISFSNEGETVKFTTQRVLNLNEALSADMDEKFYVLNPIVPSTLSSLRQVVLDRLPFRRLAEPIVFNGVNVLLDSYKERLLVKRSPRELLEGRKVELLDMVTSLAGRFGLASLLPPGPPDNIFGLVHAQKAMKNQAEVYAGVGSSASKFAEVISWNGRESLGVWKDRCSIINGTNGELYKPFLAKGKPIKVFIGDLCRTFYIDPVAEVDINGLNTYEYEISQRLFLGARNNPRNQCFCRDTRTYDCQYDGLVSMGPCFFDAPLFFARPNLKGVDRRIRSLIDEDTIGEKLPEKQSFNIEPLTGVVVKVNLTLVGLFKTVRQAYMRDLARIQNLTYFPFFATSENLILPGSFVMQLKALQSFSDYHKYIFALLGSVGVGTLVMKLAGRRKKGGREGEEERGGGGGGGGRRKRATQSGAVDQTAPEAASS